MDFLVTHPSQVFCLVHPLVPGFTASKGLVLSEHPAGTGVGAGVGAGVGGAGGSEGCEGCGGGERGAAGGEGASCAARMEGTLSASCAVR